MPMRLQKITATIFWCSAGVFALWLAGRHFLAGTDYSLVSKRQSPNGRFTVHEFQSNQDGFGHAPYGKILAISPSARLRSPDDGYVFFAGYCKSSLAYEWHNNDRVSVRCVEGNQGDGPRTLASVAYGVKVGYVWQ